VRWLVDGMNVIGTRPDGWWRDRAGAMRALVERLEAFAAVSGDPVTVVFDGRDVGLDARPSARVAVTFAGGHRGAADDEIAARAREDADPGSLNVVTSDAALVARARATGARIVSSGAFQRKLDRAAQPGTQLLQDPGPPEAR
jgi:predicted RNA-binding protein with PIN domain